MNLSAVLLSVVILLTTIAVYFIRKRLNYWKDRGIPHDPPHLLRGNMQGLFAKYHFQDIFRNYYNKYKGTAPFVGFFLFHKPAAFVLDLALAKNVLIKDFSNFADRNTYVNEKDEPLSAHLFSLEGERWRNLRTKLSPTFTSGKMKFMFPMVMKVANEFNTILDGMINGGTTIEVKEMFARFTTDVIGTCAFGIECNSLKDPNAEFRVMGRRSFEPYNGFLGQAIMQAFPDFARKLHLRTFHPIVSTFFMGIVRDTVAYRQKNHIKRNDFMDMLIEMMDSPKDKLKLEEIAAQAFVFFLAGFETSSTTGSFALFELALNPDVQDKLRLEVNEVLAKHDNEFTYECMKDMKYMDQVISETLRLYTIVTTLDRVALNDYPVPGHPKMVIEKGTPVLIPATAIHRDPEIYPNPNKFDPDHFTAEKVLARESVAWLPFGDGPRNCIGMRFGQMQTRIGLATLLQRFKFSVAPETVLPLEIDVKNPLCGSKGGIYLKVERI